MKSSISEKTRQRAMQLYEWARAVDPFNLGVSVFLVLMTIFFSLPVVALTGIGSKYTVAHYEVTTARAIGFAALGIASFAVSYYLASKRRSSEKALGLFRYEWNNRRAWIAFAMLFGGGFLIKIVRILTGQHLSNMYIDPADALFLLKFMISLNALHYMGIAIAFVSYFHLLRSGDPRSRAWSYAAWTTFVMAIVFGLLSVTGRLSLLTPVLIYLIAKHYLHSRSHVRIVIAALLAIFVLFPAKMVARDYSAALNYYFADGKQVFAWYTPRNIPHGMETRRPDERTATALVPRNIPHGMETRRPDERTATALVPRNIPHGMETRRNWDFFDSMLYSGALDAGRYSQLNVSVAGTSELTMDATVGRIGQLHIFSAVVEATNTYLYGRNIPYILNHLGVSNSIIEKVVGMGPGTDFAVKYGITKDMLTGVGSTQMGDLYMNFGFYGIVLGMAVLGFLYSKIYYLHVAGAYPSGIFVYAILWIALLHGQEQTLSAAYGRALQLFLILFVIQFFISRVPLFGKAHILDRNSTAASEKQ